MGSEICLVLHRKSANGPKIKEAVKHVRSRGIKLRVRIPWNKKDKPRVVAEALADGATCIIAGGGDGTINAVVNAMAAVCRSVVDPWTKVVGSRTARHPRLPS